jgi:hypothetical protein
MDGLCGLFEALRAGLTIGGALLGRQLKPEWTKEKVAPASFALRRTAGRGILKIA